MCTYINIISCIVWGETMGVVNSTAGVKRKFVSVLCE